VSTGDPNPGSTGGSADEPAALAPDNPTAVHDAPDPAAPRRSEADAPAAALANVQSGGGPAPAAEAARVIESAATVPSPDDQAASAVGDGPVPRPPVTSSGLPNPYGLPEIAVERPEVGVGAAFAGGLVLAMILKRFAR
jgi:hypothetical protein